MFLATACGADLAAARDADLAPLPPADLVASPWSIWAIMAGPIGHCPMAGPAAVRAPIRPPQPRHLAAVLRPIWPSSPRRSGRVGAGHLAAVLGPIWLRETGPSGHRRRADPAAGVRRPG
jgi:hypothetical protein